VDDALRPAHTLRAAGHSVALSFDVVVLVMFATLIELATFGIILGTVYALVAIGLSLIFGVSGIVNLTHGDFVMLGAFITFGAWSFLGVNPIAALLISTPTLFLAGVVMRRYVVGDLAERGLMPPMMLTFGISMVIWNTAEVVFTPKFRSIDYLGEPLSLGFVTASTIYFVAFCLAVVLLITFYVLLKFTDLGKAIRAVSQNRDVARACGINVKQIEAVAFGLGAALAGACGTMVAMLWTIYPQMGLGYLSKAFAIVVIGGMGSLPGAFLGAYVFGVTESIGTYWLSSRMAQVLPFAFIVLILAFRRRGILSGSSLE
jgi:branched-chain amino acid transport system permease protein